MFALDKTLKFIYNLPRDYIYSCWVNIQHPPLHGIASKVFKGIK